MGEENANLGSECVALTELMRLSSWPAPVEEEENPGVDEKLLWVKFP